MRLRFVIIAASSLVIASVFFVLPAQAETNSGYEELQVPTSSGTFFIRAVRINLSNPNLRIYTLTGTSGDCTTCVVKPLKEYVDQVGGFAGINGSYFCPADYASCAGQQGSSYWMWYNTLTDTFTNAYQNQFNPQGAAIAFDTTNNPYFMKRANDWPGKTADRGRFEDLYNVTMQAAMSNGPTLMYEGQKVVTADQLDDKQRTVKSARSGIGFKNGQMYLIVASGATVLDLGNIMQTLSMVNAVNLDGGGSSALVYSGQYKAGPGRNIPNAIVFAEGGPVPTAAPASSSFFAYADTLRGGFNVAGGNVQGDDKEEIIFGTGDGIAPQVRVFTKSGKVLSSFYAFDSSLRNGVSVSACDVNHDGYDEIVTAQGRGALPIVRIFTYKGVKLSEFPVLDGKFTGGVNLSCGDTDGNNKAEVVVAARNGGGAQVMVFDLNGKVAVNFFAYDPSFRGGINVTTIDTNGDGHDEIVTGPYLGAPHVQIFQIKPNSVKRVSPGFYAYDSSFRGGVSVSGVDIEGDGTDDLLIGPGSGMSPLVKVFDNHERLKQQWYAFAPSFQGGVNVSGGDFDADGEDEVVVVPRSGGGPQVRVIEAADL